MAARIYGTRADLMAEEIEAPLGEYAGDFTEEDLDAICDEIAEYLPARQGYALRPEYADTDDGTDRFWSLVWGILEGRGEAANE